MIDKEIYDELVELEFASETPNFVGDTFIRFMSPDEFYAFKEGRELINERKHSFCAHTDSEGFCFLRIGDYWNTSFGVYDELKAVQLAYEFLSGIVSDFVAVVFRNKSAALKKGRGVYVCPWTYDEFGDDCLWEVDEYSTTHYHNESMVPVVAYMWPDDVNSTKVVEF